LLDVLSSLVAFLLERCSQVCLVAVGLGFTLLGLESDELCELSDEESVEPEEELEVE
jgi:hypothetical protein